MKLRARGIAAPISLSTVRILYVAICCAKGPRARLTMATMAPNEPSILGENISVIDQNVWSAWTYPPRAVTSSLVAPQEPRLASSNASISDSGVGAFLNLIHFAWEMPLERQTVMVALAKVANKAMSALSVIS